MKGLIRTFVVSMLAVGALQAASFAYSPPAAPSLSGRTDCTVGTLYSYYAYTTHPDANVDGLEYQFSWGDGTTTTVRVSGRSSPAASSHAWSLAGRYGVKVRARAMEYDQYLGWFAGSDWSSWSAVRQVTVSVPRPPSFEDGTR